jgi:hypothetical protein
MALQPLEVVYTGFLHKTKAFTRIFLPLLQSLNN